MRETKLYLAQVISHGGGTLAAAIFTFPPSRDDLVGAFSSRRDENGQQAWREMVQWRHPPEPLASELTVGDAATYAVSHRVYLKISCTKGFTQ